MLKPVKHFLSIRLSVHLPVCPSACLSICLYVHPPVCPTACLSIRLSVRPPVCPSPCLSIRLSIQILKFVLLKFVFCLLFRDSGRNTSLPLISMLESLYLLVIIPLELYNSVLHHVLGLSSRLPFIPLLLTSVYCAVGVTYFKQVCINGDFQPIRPTSRMIKSGLNRELVLIVRTKYIECFGPIIGF